MKLSRKWLNEFVTVDADDKEFAESMTLSGSKVEVTEDLGAEIKNVVERLEGGARFMTTSCCAAWVQAVKKHLPALKEFVSHTKTPASYTA